MQLTEQTAIELTTALLRVERLLKTTGAVTKEPKPLWCKVGELRKHTVWSNGYDYERARVSGWVNYRVVKRGYEYDLNSIESKFLITPNS